MGMSFPVFSQNTAPLAAQIVPFRATPTALPLSTAKPPERIAEAVGSVWLQFSNSDISAVARSMGTITGRQVLVDARVEGTLNLQSNSAVSPAIAWEMFTQALLKKNLALLATQGMYIIVPSMMNTEQLAPASNDKPPQSSPSKPAQGKQSNALQTTPADFEISVEWAKAPKPTLPQPAGAPEPVQASADEPLAIWSLQTQDKTLYHSISRWAQSANWQLMWEAERDFPILAQISIEGGFTAAIQLVMNSLASTDYPLQAVMNNATRVISVIRHQDPFAR